MAQVLCKENKIGACVLQYVHAFGCLNATETKEKKEVVDAIIKAVRENSGNNEAFVFKFGSLP